MYEGDKIPTGDARELTANQAKRRLRGNPVATGQGVYYGTSQGLTNRLGDVEGVRANAGPSRAVLNEGGAFNRLKTFASTTAQRAGDAAFNAGSTLANGARVGGGLARTAMRGSIPAAVGAGAAYLNQQFDAPGAPEAPFVPPPNAPGQIPIDPNQQPGPPRIAQRSPLGVGPNNDFTRNVANSINAVPGASALAGTVRAGSLAARTIGAVQAGTGFVRGAQSASLAEDGTGPQAPQLPNAAANRTALNADKASYGAGTPGVPTPGTDGVVFKNGNSYSGKNISGDVENIVENGVSRPASLRSGQVVLSGAVGVTDYERKLAAEGEARAAGERNQGAVVIGDARGAEQEKLARERDTASFLAGSKLSSNAREGEARMEAVDRAQTAFTQQGQQDAGERTAALAAATQRYGHDSGVKEAGLRAQGAGAAASQKFMLEQLATERDRGLVRSAFKTGDPAGALARFGRTDLAKDVQGYSSGAQGQRDASDAFQRKRIEDGAKLFAGESFNVDPKTGAKSFDPVSAQQKAETLYRLTPGFDQLTDPAAKQKAQLEASLMVRLQGKIGGGDYTGAAGVFGTREPNELIPDVKGGGVQQYGFLKGAATFGVGRGEFGLTLPDGKEINVGKLTQQERELLQDWTKNGINPRR